MVYGLEPDQACLVLRDATEADAEALRCSLHETGSKVVKERRLVQKNGLITLMVVLPAKKLSDLMLDLALRGVEGELAGYEAGGPGSAGREG